MSTEKPGQPDEDVQNLCAPSPNLGLEVSKVEVGEIEARLFSRRDRCIRQLGEVQRAIMVWNNTSPHGRLQMAEVYEGLVI